MAHYLIAQIKENDNSWVPDYVKNVHDIVHRHGGKYRSRSGDITAIEGDRPAVDLIALLEFPTAEALQGLVTDPDYSPYAKARQEGTDSLLFTIGSSDAAGTIPYLPAGV